MMGPTSFFASAKKKRKKLVKLGFGVVIGVLISHLVRDFSAAELTGVCRNPRSPDSEGRLELEPVRPLEDGDPSADKGLLLVGVMTASKYLDTRARAVYETWGASVPGKIIFFSSENSRSRHLPLVPLAGVDDSYPPQKKSFHMLKYMHDHYIDRFEWFLRADDDVYVRTDRIAALLRGVNSRKPWFIGQTGRGNNEEFGLLSLESDENFCMGGPGVILSRETLRRVAPHVDSCLGALYTGHEDVELGRCVRKFAGVSCTWSYEASDCDCKMQVILYHNQSGQAAFTGDLKQKEVHRAITLHPIKQPENMYRLHKYVKGLKIQDNQQEKIDLHREIANSMRQLGFGVEKLSSAELVENLPLFEEPLGSDDYLGDPKLLGLPVSLNRFKPDNVRDVLEWELISKSLFSYKDLNPKKRIGTSLKEGLGDVVREIMELINSYSKQRGRVIDFKEILYGYWRLDPQHGVDLVLDLLLIYRKYRGHKMTVHVRRHAYVQQTFTGIEIREITDTESERNTEADEGNLPIHRKLVNGLLSKLQANLLLPVISERRRRPEKEFVNFILPLKGRFETFLRFLTLYENVCLREEEETRLVVILYRDEKWPEDQGRTVEKISALKLKYPKSDLSIIYANESFSRGRALQYGVNAMKADDLMFFVDVDIIFDSRSLFRIRRNTVKNGAVYFPIVFSLYNPKLANFSLPDYHSNSLPTEIMIDENSGFWRQFGFGIASLYKSDYLKLGGFNMTIHGWGFEDVTFYENAIKSSLKLARSVDTSLVHVYHTVDCDSGLENAQKNMCIGTQASTLGSLRVLQNYIKKYKYAFR